VGETQRITSHSIYKRGGERKWTLEVRRKGFGTSKTRWPTEKAARQELARLKKLDEAGVRPTGPRTPFVEIAEAWQDWYFSIADIASATIVGHKGALNAWIVPAHGEWGFVNHRVESVTREEITRLMVTMREQGRAESTIANTYTTLRLVMAYAVDMRYIERSPFDAMTAANKPRIRRRRTPEIYEVADIWNVFDAIRRRRGTAFPDFALAWLTAYYQGMRISEVLQVRAADLNWTRGTLMRRSIKTDGVPGPRYLLGPLGPLLREYVDSHGITGYLWPRLGRRQLDPAKVEKAALMRAEGWTWVAIGQELGVSNVWAKRLWEASQGPLSFPDEPATKDYFRQQVWVPALEDAGLTGFLAKDLRNTCIVHLIDGDMTGEPWDQPAVAHHVDHDLRMTQQIYYRFRPERLTGMKANSHSLEEMSVDEAIRRYRPDSSPRAR
jgi:integrase